MVVSLWVLALYVVALHARRPVHFNSSSVEKLSQSKQNSSEKAESTGHLSLLEATQTSFHASYKSLAFRASIISEKEAKSALYTVPSNENLFRLETTPSGKIFQFLDKPEIIVNTSMAGSLDSHTDKLYPLIQEYSSRPEMAHIRLLSKSLGEQGMDGSKYPIALWLHRLAAASPKPSVEHGSEEASFLERYKCLHQYAGDIRSLPGQSIQCIYFTWSNVHALMTRKCLRYDADRNRDIGHNGRIYLNLIPKEDQGCRANR
eukprot:1360367-Amorphochlora_amoeboformis.AAC.2